MGKTDIREFAIDTARRAGALLKEHVGKVGRIEFKGAVDIVTEVDRKSEDLIMAAIRKSFPGHGILTEESPELKQDSPYKWIIDPLDGTTNYSHGFPFFCVSIGFEEAGEVTFGVVYDPMLDELYTAEKGNGAALNGKKIKVSAIDDLGRSLLATGFPYDLRASKDNNLNFFSEFAVKAQAIRRAGSAALDLCYIASGRFDGYWEMKLRPWDVAAGTLIVSEAGGRVTDFSGGPFSVYGKEFLASNGLIHEDMTRILTGKA
jgi:myo-inositol-1(or 4)-monophosphatase